jgi:manganese/zinc/iron transport system substrate-binding protein
MIDDLVGRVGGERVVHIALVEGEMDPHSYELVKGDSEKFSLAQVVFYNGLGLEHGASLHYQLQAHPQAWALGDALQREYPEEIIRMEGQVDPHVWMDISLWAQTVDTLVSALTRVDPAGEEMYKKNGIALREEMMRAHQALYGLLQAVPEALRYIVTSHDAFNYFARAYLATREEVASGAWRQRFAAPEGLAPEGQIGLNDIQQVIQHLVHYNIHVVFPEANVSRDSLKKVVSVCKERGFMVRIAPQALYGDSMGNETYLGMMQYDAHLMVTEWEK